MKRVKLSKNLKEVFNKSFEWCKERNIYTVPVNIPLALSIKFSMDNINDGDSLGELFKKFSSDKNKVIYSLCNRELSRKDYYSPKSFSSFFDKEVSLGEEVENIIRECERAREMAKLAINSDYETELTIIEFIPTVLRTVDNEFVNALKSSGVTFEEIFKTSMEIASAASSFNWDDIKSRLGMEPRSKRIESSPFLDQISDNKLESENEEREFEKAGEMNSGMKMPNSESKTPFLDQYSFNMNEAAKTGKYDPVVGRDSEVERIIEILCCRKKNNAVLLGDPGCGKTAAVECLVQKIVDKKVPMELQNKTVYSLDLNSLVSGTKFRGEYEQRLQGIIKEVCDNEDIIVYIDELHNLVGNGSIQGSGDGANILKPYLARGEFQCIGSTTFDEYRKFIEKDGALKRRFQNVFIGEPSIEETIAILTEIAPKYEEFHKVKYSEEVIKSCVDWSGRYIYDRFFPDKAIDCLDSAGSLAKLRTGSSVNIYEDIENKIKKARENKIKAVSDQEFEQAAKFRDEECNLIDELEKMKSSKKEEDSNKDNWVEVTLNDVSSVISKIAKIPVDKINKSDLSKLSNMRDILEKKVVGQNDAVNAITTSIQRNIIGLRDENKPIAALLLVGPTGTGKTLISKELAKQFFGSDKSLIRFDMAEFSEKHEVTKLTGATASYVGYDDTPLLDQVRRNPYSVILFDEIEKADKSIYNIFLSILDEGVITLGNGTKVDFRNSIIIFTGNVGTKELQLKGKGMGFGKNDEDTEKKSKVETVMRAVKKEFRPEFINRLSETIVFNSLGKDELMKIFDLELEKLKERLSKKGYSLNVSNSMKELIVSETDSNYGARDLQRGIVKRIENEICSAILEHKNPDSIKTISVDYLDEKTIVKFNKK